ATAVARYLTSHLTPATLAHGHPAPSLTALALIHGYTTGFWAAAAILAAGAAICGTLYRPGPLPAPTAAAPAATTKQPASQATPTPIWPSLRRAGPPGPLTAVGSVYAIGRRRPVPRYSCRRSTSRV